MGSKMPAPFSSAGLSNGRRFHPPLKRCVPLLSFSVCAQRDTPAKGTTRGRPENPLGHV